MAAIARVIIPHRARMTRRPRTKKKETKRTLVYGRDSAAHTCEQLHVQLSAIYRITGHRQTNYLIICDRSEKLERPTVKPLSGMPHSSGKKKIMSAAKKGDLCIVAEESRYAAVFGGKFAKSFPSFRKVRIAKASHDRYGDDGYLAWDEDSKEFALFFPALYKITLQRGYLLDQILPLDSN